MRRMTAEELDEAANRLGEIAVEEEKLHATRLAEMLKNLGRRVAEYEQADTEYGDCLNRIGR